MNHLREIRLAKGLTLREVAALAETTPTQLSRLETGKRKLDVNWMTRLARALGVTARELIDGIDNIPTIFNIEKSGAEPDIIELFSLCHQIVMIHYDGYSDNLKKFLDHRFVFLIAKDLTLAFEPLFEKLVYVKDGTATIAHYAEEAIIKSALQKGRGDIVAEIEEGRRHLRGEMERLLADAQQKS